MKLRLLLSGLLLAFTTSLSAQTTEFSDDFESGTGNWNFSGGNWGLATSYVYNGTYSLADSPAGLYANLVTSYATCVDTFDLTSALDLNMYMRVKFDIENGFDYCYVQMSNDGGSNWTTVYTFNGENNLSTWTDLEINVGGFVGYDEVLMRFQWYSDPGYQAYGIYIDSLRLVSDTTDNAPPLIVHEPDPHFEGQSDTNYRYVTITDISGVAYADMTYIVDGGTPATIFPIDTNGDVFTFAIPPQDAGAWVEYQISAADSSPQVNSAVSQPYEYIAGNYIKHDNAEVNTVVSFSSTFGNSGVASRITLDGQSTLTTALIRNYTDVNNPNDSIEVHVWSNNNGNPGSDLITPFNVFPEANLLEPQRMTRIDLRPLEQFLDSLSGDIFIGFEVPSGTAWVCQTTAGNGRGRTYNGTWNNATTAFHFRAITTDPIPVPEAYFTYDASNDPTVAFTDSSLYSPTEWLWDFDDGTTDSVQNPNHTFANPGTYNVCLTATNFVGSSAQYCEDVTVVNAAPVALFLVNTNDDPTIEIDEFSQNNPTAWDWDFGDGNTSNLQEPTHTYLNPGTYDVCLVASNAYGSDTSCQAITLTNQLPIPFFDWEVFENNIVAFDNQTALGVPTATTYLWEFNNNGDTSVVESPTYTFPQTGGIFNVCLTASNAVGSSQPFCQDVELPNLIIGVDELTGAKVTIAPNPASDLVMITAEEGFDLRSVRVYALDGSLIQLDAQVNRTTIELDVTSLTSGVYFIELESTSGMMKLPLVVQ